MRKRINILDINNQNITHRDFDAEFHKEEENHIFTGTFTMPTAKENGGSIARNPDFCIIETIEDIPLKYYARISGDEIIFKSSWGQIIDGGLLDTRRYIFSAVSIKDAEEKKITPKDVANRLKKYLDDRDNISLDISDKK